MNFSQTGSSSGQDFLQKLDETERECMLTIPAFWHIRCTVKLNQFCMIVLKAGQDSTAQLRQWRDKGLRQLKSVDINARN